MTKIYFAGSIRGGRGDVEWYGELVKEIKAYGNVLSEHVANPSLKINDQKLTVRQIFQQDLRWIRESDAIIAEVTTPSLGVGYELGYAEALKIPALCLFQKQKDRSLSAMISGSLYFENNIVEYEKGDKPAIRKILKHFFEKSVVNTK